MSQQTDADAILNAFDDFEDPSSVKASGSWQPEKKTTLTVEVNELLVGEDDRWKNGEMVPWMGFRYTVADGEQSGRTIFGVRLWKDTEPPKDDKAKQARDRGLQRMKGNFETVLGQATPAGVKWSELVGVVRQHLTENGPVLASVTFNPSTNKKGYVTVYDDIKRLVRQ